MAVVRSALKRVPCGQRPAVWSPVCWFSASSRAFAAASGSGNDFDYVVVGGGSGGVSSARRAAGHGAKVAIVEKARWGGTCVNVGCVPKKVMFNAALVRELTAFGKDYGYDVSPPPLDWAHLKQRRDAFVSRLNGIYGNNLGASGVTTFTGAARLEGANAVSVDGDTTLTADHIMLAPGGIPFVPDIPGSEHAITSDGFFALAHQPQRVAVVGGGYIGVELSGIFNALGSETHVIARNTGLLKAFDTMLQHEALSHMTSSGVDVRLQCSVASVDKQPDGLHLTLTTGDKLVVDTLLMATGRRPAVDGLNLDGAGVEQHPRSGAIVVDEYQNTSVDGVYAVGDVTGRAELTPVAIAAGRLLADRLFAGRSDAKLSYDTIPTVVFSHPTIGAVGLTEDQARATYPDGAVKVYTSTFRNIFYGVCDHKETSTVKMVCVGPGEVVAGLHVIGMAADEMMQGFGVAVKMGAKKADFDACVAIHPTAAEELVTLAPWNPAPSSA